MLVELLLGVAPASPSDSDKSITREQWQFIQGCWSEIPQNRRTTNEALEFVDVNLALYVPFRAISLTTTEMHSRSSKTDSSKPRLVLSRRDFSPGDTLPPGQYTRLLSSRLRWTLFRYTGEFGSRFASLAESCEGCRGTRKLTRAAVSHSQTQAAVSVILNDIFDTSHIVPQWDSKETEHAVISHAYNVLVEDIKMISDALRVLQTTNPKCVLIPAKC